MLVLSLQQPSIPPKQNRNRTQNKNTSPVRNQNRHKHIQNLHNNLQKSIKVDLNYIEQHCGDKLDIECMIRWDRVASVSKSTKALLIKYLESK